MQGSNVVLLVQNVGIIGKLAAIGGLLVFAGILYLILPRLMNSRFRGYYEQCDLEDEAEQDRLEEDTKNEI